MKIIILGAGQVGAGLAFSLSREHNDITIVDTDQECLRELLDRIDVRTVNGNGSHPQVLQRAGIEDADMLVAVTNSDEVNMIACQVAYALFETPTRIARVREAEYLTHPDLFITRNIPIDLVISPEQQVCSYIERLIEYPGALQVLDFARGKAQIVAVRARSDGPLVGQQLSTLREHLPGDTDARVVAIFRGDEAIVPGGQTVIHRDDLVFFLAAHQDIRVIMGELRRQDAPVKRIMLAGGGNIGSNLAEHLEDDYHVKLIERSPQRASVITERLEKTIILVGDCADVELLKEEGIDRVDVFCALTNDDEANILSSMLAKKLGAGKVLTLINRPAYADLIETELIDVAVSPRQITIGALLSRIRRGNIERVHSLRRGAAEAIEAVAKGNPATSGVVGERIGDLKLPASAAVGGIVRDEQVIIAHDDVCIQENDHVILLVADKNDIHAIEQLFALPDGNSAHSP